MELRSGRLVTVMLHRHGVALQWKVGNVECALNLGQHKMDPDAVLPQKSCGHGKAVGRLSGTAGVIPRTVPFTVPVADHWTQFRGEGDRGSRDFPASLGQLPGFSNSRSNDMRHSLSTQKKIKII